LGWEARRKMRVSKRGGAGQGRSSGVADYRDPKRIKDPGGSHKTNQELCILKYSSIKIISYKGRGRKTSSRQPQKGGVIGGEKKTRKIGGEPGAERSCRGGGGVMYNRSSWRENNEVRQGECVTVKNSQKLKDKMGGSRGKKNQWK